MDVSTLFEYINIITMGICLCVGYALKLAFSKFPNRFIPLTMLILGTVINLWMAKSFESGVILGGMISGLASTGCYEMLRNLIKPSK